MTIQNDGYYYHQQIKRVVLQFCAIFQGMQVSIGKNSIKDERLMPVHIHYGDMDRAFAASIANNVQTSMLKLPMMSVKITSIVQSPSRQHGVGMERRQSYVPIGGLLPDDIQIVYQRAPTPYDIQFELSIVTTNSDQHFQILEQIMPLFDPQMTIQTSDGVFDMTRIVSVKMDNGPTFDAIAADNSRRIVSSYITFTVAAYIDTPANVRQNYIKNIMLRIAAVDSNVQLNDLASQFDAMGLPYEQLNEDQTPL